MGKKVRNSFLNDTFTTTEVAEMEHFAVSNTSEECEFDVISSSSSSRPELVEMVNMVNGDISINTESSKRLHSKEINSVPISKKSCDIELEMKNCHKSLSSEVAHEALTGTEKKTKIHEFVDNVFSPEETNKQASLEKILHQQQLNQCKNNNVDEASSIPDDLLSITTSNSMLQSILAHVGHSAFGIVSAEVWVLRTSINEDDNSLHCDRKKCSSPRETPFHQIERMGFPLRNQSWRSSVKSIPSNSLNRSWNRPSFRNKITLNSFNKTWHGNSGTGRKIRPTSPTGIFFGMREKVVQNIVEDAKEQHCLLLPNGGQWIDPTHSSSLDEEALLAYEQLIEVSDTGTGTIQKCFPGFGLPGILWSECKDANCFASGLLRQSYHPLRWKCLHQLSADPDQMVDYKLFLQSRAYGMAAAIPFGNDKGKPRGILIVFTGLSDNLEALNDRINVKYLQQSAELIGSVLAWQGLHQREGQERAEMSNVYDISETVTRRTNGKRGQMQRESFDEENEDALHKTTTSEGKVANISTKCKTYSVLNWMGKIHGVPHSSPPPPMFFSQYTLTFFGCALTLIFLSLIDSNLKQHYPELPRPFLAPFSAVMTLQYGLTAAPASQPRNIIHGHAVACAMVISLSHLLRFQDNLPPWFSVPILTSLSIATMTGLGITHPPAGAAAWLFAVEAANINTSMIDLWKMYAGMMVGNIIVILTSIVINNISEHRQYPIYWHVLPNFVISLQLFLEDPCFMIHVWCFRLLYIGRKKPL